MPLKKGAVSTTSQDDCLVDGTLKVWFYFLSPCWPSKSLVDFKDTGGAGEGIMSRWGEKIIKYV